MVNEPLAKSVDQNIPLEKHLCQVRNYAYSLIRAYHYHWRLLLGEGLAENVESALLLAAISHDLGKASEGFQKALLTKNYHWRFRHEVLSVAILLGSGVNTFTLKLAASAVLTHHRDLKDEQLKQNAGWIPWPDEKSLGKVRENYLSKLVELKPYWNWIKKFFQKYPELSDLTLPENSEKLPLLDSFIDQLIEEQENWQIPGNLEAIAILLTRGSLMASDHAVSAGLTVFKSHLPNFSLPSLRHFQKRIGSHEGNAILEAPTGSGKTIAAIKWILNNRIGGERIFYILPYQASIEAMADTLEKWFGQDNVSVLHARSIDYIFREHFERSEQYEIAFKKAQKEVELNRLVHKPIKVTTPYQLLKWLFGIPRWEIGISEMVGGLFVFDEIHSYDAHVIALIVEMVRFIKSLGGRFLFMSATFPEFLKKLLKEAVENDVSEFYLEGKDEWERQFLNRARHILRWYNESLEDMLPVIEQKAGKNQRVLVVCNRVSQAQKIFKSLDRRLKGVYLLHSRFTRRDRTEKERMIIESLREHKDDVRVLVATQVVEVSLDISFDTIFTEVAPIDDLLQRFGRVNRYNEYPEGVEVHITKKFDYEALKNVYNLEIVNATVIHAPSDGTPLSAETMLNWIHNVYKRGLSPKDKEKFDVTGRSFRNIIDTLRPLSYSEKGKEEFSGLFRSIEVLPHSLYSEYEELKGGSQFLLATQLLVPIPLGTFYKLKNLGLIELLNDNTVLTNLKYSEKLGLLIDEVDLGLNVY